MLLIMSPSPHRRSINRAANLHHARRRAWPFALMEIHTTIVPWQSQELHHSSRLRLGIRNHLLIENLKHRQIDHRFPMGHQLFIKPVEMAEVPKVMLERLRIIKVRHIARKTCIHWITPAMNDPRRWKKRTDQPKMKKIQWHLIGN